MVKKTEIPKELRDTLEETLKKLAKAIVDKDEGDIKTWRTHLMSMIRLYRGMKNIPKDLQETVSQLLDDSSKALKS